MKKLDFIFALLFIIIFGIFGISFLYSKNKEFSNTENRTLTKKPVITLFDISSSKTLKTLEKSYQDQFLFRDILLELETRLKNKIGIIEKNEVYLGKQNYLLEKPKEIKQSDIFISSLNDFYKKHNDLNMSLLLIPSHITINPKLLDKNVPIFDQYRHMKSIYRNITFNTIDLVPVLKQGLRDYEMYYHLDSHLTSYGAYYVYQKYAELNDLKALSIDQFDIEIVTQEFSGNLVTSAHTFSWENDSIVVFHPKKEPQLEVQYNNNIVHTLYHDEALNNNMYSYFLGEQEPIIQITNQANQGEILVIKDSSANAIVPFLVNHYSKVHVIDTHFYQQSISKYLNDHKEIKDVIFIYDMNQLDVEIDTLMLD